MFDDGEKAKTESSTANIARITHGTQCNSGATAERIYADGTMVRTTKTLWGRVHIRRRSSTNRGFAICHAIHPMVSVSIYHHGVCEVKDERSRLESYVLYLLVET